MKKRGRGLSSLIYPIGLTGGGDPSQAIVRMRDDGRVDLIVGSVDVGQGAKTVLAQIAAEELGLSFESIVVTNSDTNVVPICHGTWASRVTHMTGNAVKRAATELRQQILEIAAPELGVSPAELEMREGLIAVKAAPEQAVPISDIAQKATWSQGELLLGRGSYMRSKALIDPDTGVGEPYDTYCYGACVAEVEVDTDSGHVDVLKLVCAMDVGKAINPLLLEGQIEGGAAMGLGMAVMEDLTPFYPNTDFQPSTFADYLIPTAADIPEMVSIIIEVPSISGPYGVKGIGESACNPQAPAIINAIYDAVGVWITDLPATAQRVLQALDEKREAEAGRQNRHCRLAEEPARTP